MTAHTDPEDHTVTTPDRYPPGGCILCDKTTCQLPYATCCDEGRSQRWPRCNCPLGCNAPTQQSPAVCPYHSRHADAGGREHQAEETP